MRSELFEYSDCKFCTIVPPLISNILKDFAEGSSLLFPAAAGSCFEKLLRRADVWVLQCCIERGSHTYASALFLHGSLGHFILPTVLLLLDILASVFPVSVLVQGCKSDLDRPASPLCVWPFQPLHNFGKPQCSSVLSCPKLDPPKKAPANTMGSLQLVACSDLLLAIPLLQGNDWFIWPEEGCCHMIWRPSPPRIDTLSPSGSDIEAPHCSHLSGHHALKYCVLQSVQPVP